MQVRRGCGNNGSDYRNMNGPCCTTGSRRTWYWMRLIKNKNFSIGFGRVFGRNTIMDIQDISVGGTYVSFAAIKDAVEFFNIRVSDGSDLIQSEFASAADQAAVAAASGPDPDEVQVSNHPHLLKKCDRLHGWSCDGRRFDGGCRSGGEVEGGPRFRCDQCDFDFCPKCLEAHREKVVAAAAVAEDPEVFFHMLVFILSRCPRCQFCVC
jgi:hypothetical protein